VNHRLKVLLADDHAPTRGDVRAVLEGDERFEVVAEASDAARAIELAVREPPDVCLLDIHMPGNGIAAIWEITARLPETRVVMLTVSAEDDDVFGALRAGASGYLVKDMDFKRLPHALLDVVSGEAAIPRRLVARVLDEFRDRSPMRRATVAAERGERLTSREWQVLDLMRQSLGTAEIARRLFLSQATVRSHIASIVKKLRVADRDEAIEFFERGR
jgi:DNA-binding NarL/FixJ family response regulator